MMESLRAWLHSLAGVALLAGSLLFRPQDWKEA